MKKHIDFCLIVIVVKLSELEEIKNAVNVQQ